MSLFEKQVREWLEGRPASDSAIKRAIKHYEHSDKATREHAQECATFAKGIEVGFSKEELEDTEPLPPSVELDSRRLAEGLRPEVEALRNDLFGNAQPPFKDLGRAARWIERTAKEYQGRAECREWIEYARPGQAMIEHAPAFIGSPLERLARVTEGLAKDTGLRQAAVVAVVLAGIPPILPTARIAIHRSLGGPFSHTWATVELYAANLTFIQIRKLYNRIRQRMGTTRRKALTARDVELVELVRKLGEPPIKQSGNRGAIVTYWQKVTTAWNATHRKGKLTSGRAAQSRFERLKVKI